MSKFLAVILSCWKAIDKSLGEFRHAPSITRTKMTRNYVISNIHYRDDIVGII